MSCLAKIDPRSRDQATYFDAIEQGLQESIDRVFVNEKPVNVVHVQGRFLALAQNKVRMFSETLQRRCGGIDVYYDGGVRKGVRELLLKGGSIQVLLEGELDLDEGQDCSQHPLVVLADGLQAGGLEMRQASGKHMTGCAGRASTTTGWSWTSPPTDWRGRRQDARQHLRPAHGAEFGAHLRRHVEGGEADASGASGGSKPRRGA